MHQFCPVVAKEFGVDIAIFLQNIAFWTQTNLANERHIHDGHCWTYNTLDAFAEIFPYFTVKMIRRIIDKAVDEGLIIKGNYNTTKYDRTNWYALTPKSFAYFDQLANAKNIKMLDTAFWPICPNGQMEKTEWANRFDEKGRPIPDNKTDNKTDTISDLDKSHVVAQEVIDVYHEMLPEMPKIKFVTKEINGLVKRLINEFPELSGGKEFSIDSLRRYFKGIRELAPFFLAPYETKNGNKRRSNLKTLIRIETMKKFYNGEYSA